MKFQHTLFSLIGLASLPSILAAPASGADEVQVGLLVNDRGVARLTLDSTAQECKVYKDCARCETGYWRCCFSGCAGHEMPGSHTCACIQDGKDLGASCGCT
ncbi:uncharacterized protein K441DRAFT_650780 [Cenococcum geophilum 1.58]|uniref:uncharacterized protein n=1 Tax=Cenococcum geophilum 1.58 TaxID=794803 RepID=UPI00358E752E|nr:hypothetical protein K441DRAFT_650780 [Cenococcum geophilum 1.58]